MCGHADWCLPGFRETLDSTLTDYLLFRLGLFASFIPRVPPSRTGAYSLTFRLSFLSGLLVSYNSPLYVVSSRLLAFSSSPFSVASLRHESVV